MGKRAAPKGHQEEAPAAEAEKLREVIAKITFFYCGRGDTILVEAHGYHWGLIDCCLTRSSGAYERVRHAAEQVDKLDFLCLTHPDRDHYLGMHALLDECFHDKGNGQPRFDQFWDPGIDLPLMLAIAERRSQKRKKQELCDLYQFLWQFTCKRSVVRRAIQPGLLVPVDFGEFKFAGLSPAYDRVERFEEQLAQEIGVLQAQPGDTRAHAEASNDLSAIVVLMHKVLPVNIVLGGDASAEVWEEALTEWDSLVEFAHRQATFGGVKVSHHGALGSLCPRLHEDYCQKGTTIAILSVGHGDGAHPHPDVLGSLKARGIRTYATCQPTKGRMLAGDSLLLIGTRQSGGGSAQPQIAGHDWADVEVSVWSDGGVSANPDRALLRL